VSRTACRATLPPILPAPTMLILMRRVRLSHSSNSRAFRDEHGWISGDPNLEGTDGDGSHEKGGIGHVLNPAGSRTGTFSWGAGLD